MNLRGKGPAEQLLFDSEIERTARRNNSRRRRQQQGLVQGQSSTSHSTSQSEISESETDSEEEKTPGPESAEILFENSPFQQNMAANNGGNGNGNNANPPRRTLGGYAMHHGPRHHSSLVIPRLEKAVDIKPAFLNMISANQFTGKDHEDPHAHLDNFYDLCATMGFSEAEQEAAYMILFPLSLIGEAKEWLKSQPNHSLTSWRAVEEKFLTRFFPPARYVSAKSEISIFRQGHEEAFYEAWERFQSLLRKCPNHGFDDVDQLNIFYSGLRPDIKMILDAAAGGTMMDADAEQATRIIILLFLQIGKLSIIGGPLDRREACWN